MVVAATFIPSNCVDVAFMLKMFCFALKVNHKANFAVWNFTGLFFAFVSATFLKQLAGSLKYGNLDNAHLCDWICLALQSSHNQGLLMSSGATYSNTDVRYTSNKSQQEQELHVM